MTKSVHVAGPQTPFKMLVRLIDENRISAVPIVDVRGMPLGVVSESDLLMKERQTDLTNEAGFLEVRRHRHEKAKAEGLVAGDLMTSPAVTVPLDARLTDAARTMHERNLRRLVVVDDRGKIAGIVTRSDLLQVFLRSDEDVLDDVVERVIPSILVTEPSEIEVDVRANVVTLSGEVDRKTDAEIITRVTREIDGVVGVINRLTYRWDDTTRSHSVSPLR